MKVVIAGNYSQYLLWLRDNGLTELDAIYASTPERIMGLKLKAEDVIRTGEWWKSPITEEFILTRMLP